ncbi:MAG: hypothetical protein Q9173_005342 [Seirophora scorigena]
MDHFDRQLEVLKSLLQTRKSFADGDIAIAGLDQIIVKRITNLISSIHADQWSDPDIALYGVRCLSAIGDIRQMLGALEFDLADVNRLADAVIRAMCRQEGVTSHPEIGRRPEWSVPVSRVATHCLVLSSKPPHTYLRLSIAADGRLYNGGTDLSVKNGGLRFDTAYIVEVRWSPRPTNTVYVALRRAEEKKASGHWFIDLVKGSDVHKLLNQIKRSGYPERNIFKTSMIDKAKQPGTATGARTPPIVHPGRNDQAERDLSMSKIHAWLSSISLQKKFIGQNDKELRFTILKRVVDAGKDHATPTRKCYGFFPAN